MSARWRLVPVVGGKAVYDAMRAAGPSHETHFPGVVEPVLSRSDAASIWRAAREASPPASEDDDLAESVAHAIFGSHAVRNMNQAWDAARAVLKMLEGAQ